MNELDQLSINALRFLAVDAVQKANSGHPGAPLGDAPIAYLLFHKYMRHNPKHSKWSNRDRFVLSNGHASAMLYGALHLTGYDLSIEDLEQFRQWGSRTPGHPEYGDTDGVEVTTGPLGQGFAMGVGMAIAEKHLSAVYNRPGFDIVDHYTYGLCGDGDLMEGVSHEAASLAGTLGLGKLIYLYDDNLISLDGPTELSFTEDVLKRFEAYHWHVQIVQDGNDLEGISKAIEAAQAVKDKPSLIAVRTVIGYGSPKAGTSKAHGEALGADAVKQTKKNLGWPEDKFFYVPEDAAKNWLQAVDKGAKEESDWNALFADYKKAYPDLAAEFERVQQGRLKDGWQQSLPQFPADSKPVATRTAGNTVMNAFAKSVPELIGGAADLSTSTKTVIKDSGNFHLDPTGENIYYGVREFGMCAIVNGMAAHGGVIPLRLHLLRLQRLRQAGHSPRRAHADPLHLRLHPRLHRPRRRRSHAPAHRAAHHVARRPPPHRFPPRRRQRNLGRLGSRSRAQERFVLRPLSTGSPPSRSCQPARLRGRPSRRLHRGTGQ